MGKKKKDRKYRGGEIKRNLGKKCWRTSYYVSSQNGGGIRDGICFFKGGGYGGGVLTPHGEFRKLFPKYLSRCELRSHLSRAGPGGRGVG